MTPKSFWRTRNRLHWKPCVRRTPNRPRRNLTCFFCLGGHASDYTSISPEDPRPSESYRLLSKKENFIFLTKLVFRHFITVSGYDWPKLVWCRLVPLFISREHYKKNFSFRELISILRFAVHIFLVLLHNQKNIKMRFLHFEVKISW